MKKFNLLALSLVLATFGSRDVFAAGADADGNASVVIVNQASIENTVDMDFGTLIAPNATGSNGSGTFTLSPSGALSCAQGWVCSGSPAVGQFEISANNASVSVTYENGVLSDGVGHTIALNVNGAGNPDSVNLTNGKGILKVGASLSTDWNTEAGTYSTANIGGTPYKVTVSY